MAVTARYLIDTSASARISNPNVAATLTPLLENGVVATCALLDWEALNSARTPDEYERVWTERREWFEYLPTTDAHWQTALQAQRELAGSSRHREVGIGDLLIATLASAHRLAVVHYDADFETAATVLDFQHRWVGPRATL